MIKIDILDESPIVVKGEVDIVAYEIAEIIASYLAICYPKAERGRGLVRLIELTATIKDHVEERINKTGTVIKVPMGLVEKARAQAEEETDGQK